MTARTHLFALLAAAVIGSASTSTIVLAQAQKGAETPSPADPQKSPPEKMAPNPSGKANEGASSGVGETLSEKLNRNDGVIKPPEDTTPGMNIPAPAPDAGSMPVIPPPGSPGNPSNVRPK